MSISEAAQLYSSNMSIIRDRINLVRSVLNNQVLLGSEAFETELVYLQFRKVLESIAFSSLAANKEQYASLHANFSKHWKAEQILKELTALNPDFYPMPLEAPISMPGFHHFDLVTHGFLTREDFATLYDVSSQVLHTRNPYSETAPVIQAKYSGIEWTARIQRLLSIHSVRLLNGEVFLVQIPAEGPILMNHGAAGQDLDPVRAEENRRNAVMYGWLKGHQTFIGAVPSTAVPLQPAPQLVSFSRLPTSKPPPGVEGQPKAH